MKNVRPRHLLDNREALAANQHHTIIRNQHLNEKQWKNLIHNISRSDPMKRQEYVNRQPPLIMSLDGRDAEDDTNPIPAIKEPQTANEAA